MDIARAAPGPVIEAGSESASPVPGSGEVGGDRQPQGGETTYTFQYVDEAGFQ